MKILTRPRSLTRSSRTQSKSRYDLKAGNFYQACAYAWNAFRDDKTITSIKYDYKKGLHQLVS
jgi:hypothetical protein